MARLPHLSDALLRAMARVEAALDVRDGKQVVVWRYDEAPQVLRELSTNGGDEDWLAVVPPGQTTPMWAAVGSYFGRCDVLEYELVDGSTVLIGVHS